MPKPKTTPVGLSMTFLLLAAMALPAAAAALTGNIAIHDPTIAVLEDGLVSFATGVERAPDGGQIRTKTSPDGLDWQEAGALPGGMPDWVSAELGLTPPNLWAPSVFEKDGTHYLYYAASSFGRNDSAIGLMTNSELEASDPTAGWVDRGIVLRSHRSDDFNAIDPFRIDSGGKAWLAFGSFWDGIGMVELDPATGLARRGTTATGLARRRRHRGPGHSRTGRAVLSLCLLRQVLRRHGLDLSHHGGPGRHDHRALSRPERHAHARGGRHRTAQLRRPISRPRRTGSLSARWRALAGLSLV